MKMGYDLESEKKTGTGMKCWGMVMENDETENAGQAHPEL